MASTAKKERRSRTIDRGPPGGGPPLSGAASHPLSVGEIGPNRSILPDGSLLCRNVPIARTGWMHYAPGEVPLEGPKTPGATPIIYVHRGPEDLFTDSAMRSFVGCAVTLDHPVVPVTPENFGHLGKGFILRTWRGEGVDSDCLMGDLIIKDKWTIDHYRLGTNGPVSCEVSLGYEASYEQTGDGQGRQFNIIGNHCALVDRGRCGPRCAIGDEETISTESNEDNTMTTKTQPGGARPRIPLAEARQRVVDAMADLETAETAPDTEGVHVHVHMGGEKPAAVDPQVPTTEMIPTLDAAVEERFAKLEAGQEAIASSVQEMLAAVKAGVGTGAAPVITEDPEVVTEATATMDSAALANSYQQFVAQAEILVPGFKLPTFDAAAKRHATVDRMCTGRRMVLSMVASQAGGPDALVAANGAKPFDVIAAACPDVAMVFKAAAAAKAASNNQSATRDAGTLPSPTADNAAPKQLTPAEVNAKNKQFWASQGPRA